MQCPICEKQMKNDEERLCPQCGWEFKFYLTGMSEEEEALYNRKLHMARKIWENSLEATAHQKKMEKEMRALQSRLADI